MRPKRQASHELRALMGPPTDELRRSVEPLAPFVRFVPERSDNMTARTIKAAAASLLAIAIAGCTTTGMGTGQSARGNLGATFVWRETGGTPGTMGGSLTNCQGFPGPMLQSTQEKRGPDHGGPKKGRGPGAGWGGRRGG